MKQKCEALRPLKSTWCGLLVLLALPSCSGEGLKHELVERFEGGHFNATAWKIDPKKLPEASFEVDERGLALRVPPEATGQEAAEIKSQFRFGGDFDIELQYSIHSLPMPESGYLNLETSLYSPGGTMAFMRTQQASLGPGFAIWHQPPQKDAKAQWKFVKLNESQETQSELVVRRRGSVITFLTRTRRDDSLVEVGTLRQPANMDSVQFRIVGKEVDEPVEVAFHRIRVAADELWFGDQRPLIQSSGVSDRIIVATTLVAGLLAMSAGLLVYYRRQS